MSKQDYDTTIEELKKLVTTYRDERGWKKHHSAKNLSMSIAIEAAELMELFQWDEYSQKNQNNIADELADVLIYCFNLADVTGIDIASSFRSKLLKAAKKYPVEIFNPKTDNAQAYNSIKRHYRAKST